MSFPTALNDLVENTLKSIEIGMHSRALDDSRLPRTREHELKRYAAYFRGWCQAFGEHESIQVDESGSYWLLAEKQVGLVLPIPLIKPLHREVLLHEQVPPLTFSLQGVQIGSLHFPFSSGSKNKILGTIERLVETGPELHLFPTSHFLYGIGNRIITFSNKKPLSIIYKEIGSMHIRLL